MSLLAALGRLAFPGRCPGCGQSAEVLCEACHRGLAPPVPAPPPPGLDWWEAAFAYQGALRELVARAKYRNARAGVAWTASCVARLVGGRGAGIDLVSWPPTTTARRRARGFDPAELLARQVAARLRLPVRATLWRDGSPAQTGLSGAERRLGPAFLARPPDLRGARVLLVDDVATTGQTLAAAARALRVGGASAVAAATVARTTSRRVAGEPTSREGPSRSSSARERGTDERTGSGGGGSTGPRLAGPPSRRGPAPAAGAGR